MNNEQNYVEVVLTVDDSQLIEKIEIMAAEKGISPEELIVYAMQEYFKFQHLEVIA